jgi:uncharacterized protein YfaS (alpha-2-macroglobulin family)
MNPQIIKPNSMKTIFSILPLLLLFATFSNCNKQKQRLSNDQKPPSEMLQLNKDENSQAWKTIDSLDQQNLPKSALEKVQELYAKVQKDNNPAQTIKCLIYLGKYQTILEEDGFVKTLMDMQKHIDDADFPENKILQSMIGEMYMGYLDQQYWQLQDRTELNDFKPDDIQTWTIGQLTEASRSYYLASVDDDRTQQVKLDNFAAILTEGQNAEGLQPTLFDFLMYRALERFANERNYLTKPAYQFTINQAGALGSIETFLEVDFNSPDSTADQLISLRLYQDLLRFRQNDSSDDALVYANLRRLQYVYEKAVIPNKATIYLETINGLQQKYQGKPLEAEILYLKAKYYFEQGNDYQVGVSDDRQFYWKTALELCEQAIDKYPDASGTSQCEALKQSILQKEISFITELVNLPNKPILMQVNYRNVEKLYGRIIKVDEKELIKFNEMDYEKRDNYLQTLDPMSGFSIDLPQVEDYRNHTTEVKVDPLALGTYFFIISSDQNLAAETTSVQYLITHVSNIGVAQRYHPDGYTGFVLTHRESGEPLSNVKLDFYTNEYNRILRRNELKKAGSTTSDQNGFANSRDLDGRNFNVVFSQGEDRLDLGTNAANYNRSRDPRTRSEVYFFLDRGIYRPGQSVYFKGIVLYFNTDKKPSIVTNRAVTVQLRDVNRQVVETLELRSNDYGTINGVFTAPQGSLTGSMSLEAITSDGSSRKSFRVEEYKRPKFEVKFDPVSGSFKLDEEVTLSGQAKAYAGNSIDGAQVVYRVVREARFPYYPWWRWGGYRPSKPAVEITNGTTTTDATGKFTIDFNALSDPSISDDRKPEYNYTVYADVVDITGETHSATQNVTVGKVALRVSMDIAEMANADSLKKLVINTNNLNGQFEAASGQLKIESLQSPNRPFINRYWNKPDQYLMSPQEYARDFPLIAYENEDEPSSWPVKGEVFNQSFNTAQSKELDLSNLRLEPGKYAVTLTTQDAFGEAIEIKQFVTVYDLDVDRVPTNEVYFHINEQYTREPGESAIWHLGSINPKQKMLVEIEFDDQIIGTKWLTVNGLEKETKAIIEAYRGNIFYNVYLSAHNRFYNSPYTISVPWTNKQLSIEFGTFRDKLYPGQEETWNIKISGPAKEKVAAEMVVGMYDASLDAFAANNWGLNPYPYNYRSFSWRTNGNATSYPQQLHYSWNRQPYKQVISKVLEGLNWFGFNYYNNFFGVADDIMVMEEISVESMAGAPPAPEKEVGNLKRSRVAGVQADADGVADVEESTAFSEAEETESGSSTENPPQIRTNLKETVFFFPNLKTDADGNVIVKFTMNEALTRWKFLGLAHTKDLKIGTTSKEVVTQKDLMVLPNPPRFFREGDEITFTAKVSNLTADLLSGTATLELFDAITMQPLDQQLGNTQAKVNFTAPEGQSDLLSWKLKIPYGQLGAVVHRVVAKSGSFSDGEESALPIITNRMLVTETKPLPVRGNQTREYKFEAMQKASASNTLQHHKMTLEYTSNPAWYAVKALPYLMEYPYECTEQVFSRYYANALASSVANAHPKVKRIFEAWKNTPGALESNLTKNQELKYALLEETPWVLQAQSEAQQMRNIGLLFDLNRMAMESEQALNTIADRQLGNGGFPWFPGGRDNWYITQYIVEGLGHLRELGVEDVSKDERMLGVINNALRYIDEKLAEHYRDLEDRIKRYGGKLEDDHLDHIAVHYLYARSFFRETPIDKGTTTAFNYYLGQAEKYWINRGMYSEGMIALGVNRFKSTSAIPGNIVKSLKERSLNNEELGMYWKYNTGYYWYQLPIETHALMIEVFDEISKDAQAVDDLKVWLLKNKQTNNWKTTKATAAAVYAMLNRGDNWLLEDNPVKITLGDKVIDQSKIQTEAGTGYFKTSWDGDEITDNMSNIKVENTNKVVAWGALYWQYFEQLDKIKTFEETPLTINKKLFKVTNTATGPKLSLLEEGANIEQGDKVQVRIEIRVDRDMEYVHMKDMRASGFEPINVLSQYKYQGGLGYYESTKDVATNFFMGYLPKGTYVFEYPLRAVHAGEFSNGITTIQCMYAPEFTSHSEGIKVKID